MNEIAKNQPTAKEITQPKSSFKGYSLEEIRYQRALVALQKEFCKTKITRSLSNLQKNNPLSPNASPAAGLPGKFGAITGKFLKGLNYLDYAMIGFSVFGSVRKVMSFFRSKKKK